MQFLDLTMPTLAENLALDEALLVAADTAGAQSSELLRVWEPNKVAVIVGRSSRVTNEVFEAQLATLDADLFRRPSGGAAVVIGPGCLLYSLLIDLERRPGLRMLDQLHRYVMDGMLNAIRQLSPEVEYDGTCDLVLAGRKLSGNSVKIGRSWALYHGTFLIDMPLVLIDQLLRHPPREPDYRRGRCHSEFVTNLSLDPAQLVAALRNSWHAEAETLEAPVEIARQLASSRYLRPEWTYQR
jgi:lipoate---protein ligase